jgi:hypothetical protein
MVVVPDNQDTYLPYPCRLFPALSRQVLVVQAEVGLEQQIMGNQEIIF